MRAVTGPPIVSAVEVVPYVPPADPAPRRGRSCPTATTAGPSRPSPYSSVTGRFYLVGGIGKVEGVQVRRIEEYDPVARRWATVATLPTNINHVQAVEARRPDLLHRRVGRALPHLRLQPGDARDHDQGADATAARRRRCGRPCTRPHLLRRRSRPVPQGVDVVVQRVRPGHRQVDRAARHAASPRPLRCRDRRREALRDRRTARRPRATRSWRTTRTTSRPGRWITGLAPLPTERSGTATAVLGDEILVLGGERIWTQPAKQTVEAYHPATDTWRVAARHGGRRPRHPGRGLQRRGVRRRRRDHRRARRTRPRSSRSGSRASRSRRADRSAPPVHARPPDHDDSRRRYDGAGPARGNADALPRARERRPAGAAAPYSPSASPAGRVGRGRVCPPADAGHPTHHYEYVVSQLEADRAAGLRHRRRPPPACAPSRSRSSSGKVAGMAGQRGHRSPVRQLGTGDEHAGRAARLRPAHRPRCCGPAPTTPSVDCALRHARRLEDLHVERRARAERRTSTSSTRRDGDVLGTVPVAPHTHNAVCNLDGTRAYLTSVRSPVPHGRRHRRRPRDPAGRAVRRLDPAVHGQRPQHAGHREREPPHRLRGRATSRPARSSGG